MKSTSFVCGCLLLLLIISSCGKTTCINPGIRITFKGFDTAELGRVLISQYMSNTSFASAINITFLDTAYELTLQSNDTIYHTAIDTSGFFVAPGYDYIVEVPSEKKKYTITGISYKELKQSAARNGKGGCTNETYYYLDSMPVKKQGQIFSNSGIRFVNIVLNK